MRGEPRGFWGKLGDDPRLWHPLEAHCADVAACCEVLLQHGLTKTRLATLAGLVSLTSQQKDRLCVLAGLHDIGKFNHGFQAKADPTSTFKAGHVKEMLGLLDATPKWTERLAEAIGYERMISWVTEERTLYSLLRAAISHHGRPQEAAQFQRSYWQPREAVDPFAGMASLRKKLEHWFPGAWTEGGDQLPETPIFQHAFYGLVTLADWIASDAEFFPFAEEGDGDRIDIARAAAQRAIRDLWLDPSPAVGALRPSTFMKAVLPKFEPRPLQQSVVDLGNPGFGSVTVLEAETGAGKTEAALLYFLKLFGAAAVDGLYFALPTRTAATQIHRRVTDAVARAFPEAATRPPVVMAVPGYLQVDDIHGRKLAPFHVLWDDDDQQRFRFRAWAAEHPKRFLAGAIVVGTIDQVLLSALRVNHSHMRATALLRHLLVIDEVHASDLYMNRLLETVLDRHMKAGGHAFLMSATLGAETRARLLGGHAAREPIPHSAAAVASYPLLTQRISTEGHISFPVDRVGDPKVVACELAESMTSPAAVAAIGMEAASGGARVLVLRNTVTACVQTQLEIERLAEELAQKHLLHEIEGQPAPHHSRYAHADRTTLDQAIELQFGKKRPAGGRIVAATQTVQQSLDLDADLLITDLCPMDVLLQRIGRLHRHDRDRPANYDHAKVVVVVPSERDLSTMINPQNGKAYGANGLGTVYDDLRVIEATWRLLETELRFRVPDDNRALVEGTVHSEVLTGIVRELGGRWIVHEQKVLGTGFADTQTAHFNTANWSVDFVEPDSLFPKTGDEHIPTRLGEGDRRLVFDKPFPGPFGNTIGELTLPAWLARDIDGDATPSITSLSPGERVEFSFGHQRLTYDRLGLRPADNVQSPPKDAK